MRISLAFLSVIVLVSVRGVAVAGEVKQLFNGRDLSGWAFIPRAGEASPGFVVEDGTIKTQGGKGILWYTREKLGNTTLKVVYKVSSEMANSGVFIRIPDQPSSEEEAGNTGIEVQIDDRDNDWHCTGVLYSMTKAMARPSKLIGEWNTMEITMKGRRTIVVVNGVRITDYDGVSAVPPKVKLYEPDRHPRPDYGYIGLQHHDQRAVIWFKEISVRSVNPQ
jgi:hypothetical protein